MEWEVERQQEENFVKLNISQVLKVQNLSFLWLFVWKLLLGNVWVYVFVWLV